jgi:hypothetical protein
MRIKTHQITETFIVRQYGPGPSESRQYGPFEDKMVAELVAVGATQKHPGASAFIDPEPITGR